MRQGAEEVFLDSTNVTARWEAIQLKWCLLSVTACDGHTGQESDGLLSCPGRWSQRISVSTSTIAKASLWGASEFLEEFFCCTIVRVGCHLVVCIFFLSLVQGFSIQNLCVLPSWSSPLIFCNLYILEVSAPLLEQAVLKSHGKNETYV